MNEESAYKPTCEEKDTQRRLEMRADQAARFAEVNPRLSSASPVSNHPREIRNHEVISRAEALNLLGVTSTELSRLTRMGVIRKAHPDLRAAYLYRDVAVLANSAPGSPEREELQQRLRSRNISNYMRDFVPRAYYDLSGNQVPILDMDSVDRTAQEQYYLGLKGPANRFRTLLRPVHYSESRDQKINREVQFLYLHDDDIPAMTTALEMRRWYAETHPHARYQVKRIALPPVSALNQPAHRGVLKFLVQAASVLYNMDFETMPEDYYGMITQQELINLGKSSEDVDTPRLTMHETLTGSRITDEDELHALLAALDPLSVLPLRYSVAVWYCAYRSLTQAKDALLARFSLKGGSGLDRLIRDLNFYRGEGEDDSEQISEIRRQVETLVGCHSLWADLYHPKAPPAYIGQPPGYMAPGQEEADPLRLVPHPSVRNNTLPHPTVYATLENSLEEASREEISQAILVANSLHRFHQKICCLLPPLQQTVKVKHFVAQLLAVLQEFGVDPKALYMYPFRDVADTSQRLFNHPDFRGQDVLEAVIPELIERVGLGGEPQERPPEEELEEIPPSPDPYLDPAIPENGVSQVEITDSLREEHVKAFAQQELGFSAEDMGEMSGKDVLESLGDVTSLDDYILRVLDALEV